MQYFITNDKVNVAGLVLAGSADFKTELQLSDMFDQRLQVRASATQFLCPISDVQPLAGRLSIEIGWIQSEALAHESGRLKKLSLGLCGMVQKAVIKTVDVSYGGEAGFNQAIELAAETLGSVKLIQEKKLLQVRVCGHDIRFSRLLIAKPLMFFAEILRRDQPGHGQVLLRRGRDAQGAGCRCGGAAHRVGQPRDHAVRP